MRKSLQSSLALMFLMLLAGNVKAQGVPEILYYKFDGTGTSVPNQASNPPAGTATATIMGGLTQGGTGLCGTALVGTGASSSTDYVSTGWNTNLGTGAWTISFWTNNIPSSTTLFYQFGDGSASSFRCFTNGVAGAGNWMLRGPVTDVTCTGCAPTGAVPSMTTFVYDPTAGDIKAYHNGVLNATVTQAALNITGANFTVGGYTSSTGLAAGQFLDEFRFYSHALDANEVMSTYNACLPLVITPDDAGVASIDSPSLPSCNLGLNDLIVTLNNFGTDTLTSCNINYSINGGTVNTIAWTGVVPPMQTLSGVVVGTATFANGDAVDVWTDTPNGNTDIYAANDLQSIVLQEGLSGVYTIGATGDYLTFTDAVVDLETFGVCDDVTFNVQDGIYMEQITINDIMNTNDTNTVTFQSISADPNLCVINYDGTSTADNFVVKMNGGDHIIFRDLGMLNMGTSFGTVVQVGGGSHFNTWEGNIIAGEPNNATTSTNKSLVFSSSSIDSMNVFDGNDFMYGSYGIYWYGVGTTSLENGTKIINNNFENTYYMGIRTYYQNNVEIGYNIINPGVNYTGSIYRIYMGYNDGATRVHSNQMLGNKYGYGIYMTNCDATISENGLIYNNFVHVGDSTLTSTSYGVYMTSCNNQIFTHNSVNMDSDGTSSRGLYVTGGANNVVRNNVIQNTGVGYGFYYISGVTECDYNNVYAPNGNLYYFGANINNLNTWQNATGFGMMSDTLDPMFVGPDDLHTCAVGLDGAAMVDTLVMYDIDGDMRDANTPDIGADEFLFPANVAFDSDTIWKCTQDAVTLGGWSPSNGATFQWSTFETTPTISVSTPGTYSVNILNSCGTGSPSVEVANIPDAVADFTLVNTFMTLSTTNLSSGTISSYYWDFGDGASSTAFEPLHVYADTGYYTVTLTVTGPCGTDSYTQTMYSNTVGLDELSLATSLNVYPNPSKGEFTISMNLNESANLSATVTDLQGKLIWSSAYGSLNGTIAKEVKLTDAKAGMYLLNVTVDGASTVRRIVVE